MTKSLLTFFLLALSVSAFAGEIELAGKKYGIPTGHVQVKEPRIKLSVYESYPISADIYSAEVACDLLNMDLVNYQGSKLMSTTTIIKFDSIKNLDIDGTSDYAISSLHCKTREKN